MNDISYIKKVNQLAIVSEIDAAGSLSRTDLAGRLKLSITSVSKNAKDLIERNILIEKGEAESSGGRRPMIYTLNPQYRSMIGVDFSSEVIRIALVDMCGNVIDLRCFSRLQPKINKQTIERLIDEIDIMLQDNDVGRDSIAVITIGMQGIVNETTGEVVTYYWFEDRIIIAIREILKDEYKAEVIIKNDIKLAAIGECFYGIGKSLNDLVLISIDTGIGSGIIIDRKIYSGRRFAAGEIAVFLTNVNEIRNIKNSDTPDHLEEKISVTAIVNRIRDDVNKGVDCSFWKGYEGRTSEIDFDVFVESLRINSTYSCKILDEIAKYLSFTIINMILILDIDVVVLGGIMTRIGKPLIDLIDDHILRIMPESSPIPIKVELSKLHEKAGIYGSVIIGRDYIFKHLLDDSV